MRAPSIAQQRIALVAFVAVIGALVWWQGAGDRVGYPVQTFARTPIPEVVESIDFASAEAAWSGLQIDPQGNLRVDALTYTALSDAVALVHDAASDAAPGMAARIALLLDKQFGATASRQIIELLPALVRYQEAERRWWQANAGKNPPPHAKLFQLQDELLGEALAEKLFSEQRRLAKAMLAAYEIRNDAGRTQAELSQTQLDVQKALEKEGAH